MEAPALTAKLILSVYIFTLCIISCAQTRNAEKIKERKDFKSLWQASGGKNLSTVQSSFFKLMGSQRSESLIFDPSRFRTGNASQDALARNERSSSVQVAQFPTCQQTEDDEVIVEFWQFGKSRYDIDVFTYTWIPDVRYCDSEVGLIAEADEGILTFRAPCCAVECEFTMDIMGFGDKEILIEFLELNVPSPYTIKPDGSFICKDSKVSFDSRDVCGTTVPPPFKDTAFFGGTTVSVETSRGVMCRDYLSFTLKYRACDRPMNEQDECQPLHTTAVDGQSGSITPPGHPDADIESKSVYWCQWDIEVANDSVLQVYFDVKSIGDSGAEVQIYTTGPSFTGSSESVWTAFPFDYYLGKFGYPLTFPSNRARVTFYSDAEIHDHDVKIHYKAVSPDFYMPIIFSFMVNCTGNKNPLPSSIVCDMYDQCYNLEDERNCHYIEESSCPGGYVFNSSCYHLYTPDVYVNWKQAEEICKVQFDSHLVTPNSIEEVNFINDLVTVNYTYWVQWYLGIRQMTFDANLMYRKQYQGLDGSMVFNVLNRQYGSDLSVCTAWQNTAEHREMVNVPCLYNHRGFFVACERERVSKSTTPILSSQGVSWTEKVSTFQCTESKERILSSRVCDTTPDCNDGSDEKDCDDVSHTSQRFTCKSGSSLSYSHVCDGINDCPDNSDEEFCLPVPAEDPDLAVCENGISVPSSWWCDAKPDCLDASDELDCLRCSGETVMCPSVGCLPAHWVDDDSLDCPMIDLNGQWIMEPTFVPNIASAQPPPGIVMPDGYGKVTIQPLAEGEPCPSTHAQCPTGYCIPIYMLCNGHKDCPEGEDEQAETCQSFCKGRYKCHTTSICVDDTHLCDGWFHCPLHDDETFCHNNGTCPLGCICTGREMICRNTDHFPGKANVKVLDIANVVSQNDSLNVQNHEIVAVIAKKSNIRKLGTPNSVNLYHLDVSDNLLGDLDVGVFGRTLGIRQLLLARNRITHTDLQQIKVLSYLEVLDISGNYHGRLKSFSFAGCSNLKALQLDDMGITVVESNAFAGLSQLQALSITGNPISVFQQNIFSGLLQMSSLNSDNFKLCCSSIIPESLAKGTCQAPTDEISSCDDILPSSSFRAFLWLMATLTIVGNTGILVYKLVFDKKQSKLGYNTFIASLSVSDLLMGIYLVTIGVADVVYRGRYLWEADVWKSSSYCSLAGFLALTSSEVSAMTICLITLDRYLALAFPLGNIHMSQKCARFAVAATWILGALFAGIPLLPPLSHWQFYSQTSVCIPLPITRTSFPGSDYAFVIFIVLNFLMFLGIAVGQVLILRAVKANSFKAKGATTRRRNQDSAIAQKLALVVITDFLCWFPIGLMGILAKATVPVPGEANVVSIIFILPLNSALNPYLYNLAAVREKLKQRKALKKTENQKEDSVAWSIKSITTRFLERQSSSLCTRHDSSRRVKPEECMKKLQIWLSNGKMSTASLNKILSGFKKSMPPATK